MQILSILLYSSKKETNSVSEKGPTHAEKQTQTQDKDTESSSVDTMQQKTNPLEDLDEATTICFQVRHIHYKCKKRS